MTILLHTLYYIIPTLIILAVIFYIMMKQSEGFNNYGIFTTPKVTPQIFTTPMTTKMQVKVIQTPKPVNKWGLRV